MSEPRKGGHHMAELTIRRTELANDWISLSVRGEIDLATVDQLEEAVAEVVNNGDSHLVVDLTETSFMDSTGLKALLVTDQKLNESGRSFAIAVSPGPIARLVDLSGVQSLNVVSDVSEAVGE